MWGIWSGTRGRGEGSVWERERRKVLEIGPVSREFIKPRRICRL